MKPLSFLLPILSIFVYSSQLFSAGGRGPILSPFLGHFVRIEGSSDLDEEIEIRKQNGTTSGYTLNIRGFGTFDDRRKTEKICGLLLRTVYSKTSVTQWPELALRHEEGAQYFLWKVPLPRRLFGHRNIQHLKPLDPNSATKSRINILKYVGESRLGLWERISWRVSPQYWEAIYRRLDPP